MQQQYSELEETADERAKKILAMTKENEVSNRKIVDILESWGKEVVKGQQGNSKVIEHPNKLIAEAFNKVKTTVGKFHSK